MTHLKITQAGLTALATTIIGQLIAFVPAFSSDKQLLISAASTTIAAAFLLANSVHAAIASKASAADIEVGVKGLVHAELGRVNFNALVADALRGNLGSVVQAELTKILSGLASAAPVAPAPGNVGQTPPQALSSTAVAGGPVA